MKAIELIRWALNLTDEGTAALVRDMRDAPLTRPTSRGGNHPLWILGHLAFMEGGLRPILLGEPNPVDHWAPLFAPGTEPRSDAAVYPSFDELLRTLRELRAGTLSMLEEFSDAQLDGRPHTVPAGFEEVMHNAGQAFLLIALHQMVHYGQIADARRVAGLRPPI